MLVDFELIRRAREGDHAAFTQVVQAYRRRILGAIARLIGHPEVSVPAGRNFRYQAGFLKSGKGIFV